MIRTTTSGALLALTLVLATACASRTEASGPDQRFATSGSAAADQRADARVAEMERVRSEDSKASAQPLTLYERLGGDTGVRLIVDDWVDRAIADPRANWERKGVKKGGVLGIGGKSAEWSASAGNVASLKNHMAQFIGVATGGPTRYDGRDMKAVHAGLRITNAEFDATIGDLKATLDALRVGVAEQKELLAVLESARPEIAEER